MRRAAALVLAVLGAAARASAQPAPVVDYHQHLFSPALTTVMTNGQPAPTLDAANLIRLLDEAGIDRAIVLSTAYIWTQPSRRIPDDARHVREENDWTSQQVARFPTRLIGFCSLHPLKDSALEELAHCAADPNLRHGLKLHIGNSVVDYHNAEHVRQLRRVVQAANTAGMAIVIHARASVTEKLAWGRDEATILLNEIVSAAPDVPIQIAHLGGAGGYDEGTDAALGVFASAVRAGDPRVRRVWFDVTAVTDASQPDTVKAQIAGRIRELGVARVLYGTDAPIGPTTPKAGWAAFRTLPLTSDEFAAIAGNVAPYARPGNR